MTREEQQKQIEDILGGQDAKIELHGQNIFALWEALMLIATQDSVAMERRLRNIMESANPDGDLPAAIP